MDYKNSAGNPHTKSGEDAVLSDFEKTGANVAESKHPAPKVYKSGSWKKDFHENWKLYLIFVPVFIYFAIFSYAPMFGVLAAFQDYNPIKGITGSEWIGWQNFIDLFTGETFGLVMRNTICMAILNLTLGFIAPVILALLLSQLRFKKFKRIAQLISYMPNFVSAVVVCSLAITFFAIDGPLTQLLAVFGLHSEAGWLSENNASFWLINTFLMIWQGAGWGSIGYVAAISNINKDLYEAACIDGANRWKQLVYITLPSILPFIVMMFTLQVGLVFVQGFDKVLLLYKPATYEYTDVLSTYTYRLAFTGVPNYGLSTASGLFQSVVATILLLFSNWLNKRATKLSLF